MGTPVTPLSTDSPPPRIKVIQEVFSEDDIGMHEYNLEQLDIAIEDKCSVIVIEPKRLGSQTVRWIRMGNALSRLTTVSGLGALGLACVLPKKSGIYIPLAGVCIASHVFYRLCWSCDPCVEYQVETDQRKLETTFKEINGHRPFVDFLIVLSRKEQKKVGRLLNDVIFGSALLIIGVRLYHAVWRS